MLPTCLHIFVSDHFRSIPKREFLEFVDLFLRITDVFTKGRSPTNNFLNLQEISYGCAKDIYELFLACAKQRDSG